MARPDFCRNLLTDLPIARAAGDDWKPLLVEPVPAIIDPPYRCPAAVLMLNYPRLRIPFLILHERIHHPDDGLAADAFQAYSRAPIAAGREYEKAQEFLKAVDLARARGATFTLTRNPGSDEEPNTAGRILRRLMETDEDAALWLFELTGRSTKPNSIYQLRNLVKKDRKAEAEGTRPRTRLDEDEKRLAAALPVRKVLAVAAPPAQL